MMEWIEIINLVGLICLAIYDVLKGKEFRK